MIEKILKDRDLERLNDIYRWSFYKVHKHENIPQHSYWVIFFSNLLIEELNPAGYLEDVFDFKLKTLQQALYHDLDEIFTGDISHEVKNNGYNGGVLKELLSNLARIEMLNKFGSTSRSEENSFGSNVLNSTISKDKTISTIVKLADWLSFIKFAYNERELGNKQFEDILNYCIKSAKQQCKTCTEALIFLSEEKSMVFNLKVFNDIQKIENL